MELPRIEANEHGTQFMVETADSFLGTFVLYAEFELVWIAETTEPYGDIERDEMFGADTRRLVRDHIDDIFEGFRAFSDPMLAT